MQAHDTCPMLELGERPCVGRPSQAYAALPRRMGQCWSSADGQATRLGSLRQEEQAILSMMWTLQPALTIRRLPAPTRLANSYRPPPPWTASCSLPASDSEGPLSGPAGHVTAPSRPSSRVRATFWTPSSLRMRAGPGASPTPCPSSCARRGLTATARTQSHTEYSSKALHKPCFGLLPCTRCADFSLPSFSMDSTCDACTLGTRTAE